MWFLHVHVYRLLAQKYLGFHLPDLAYQKGSYFSIFFPRIKEIESLLPFLLSPWQCPAETLLQMAKKQTNSATLFVR